MTNLQINTFLMCHHVILWSIQRFTEIDYSHFKNNHTQFIGFTLEQKKI